MAGDNFQDNVELRSDTILHAKGNAVMVGTDAVGAKSYIFAKSDTEGHLAWDPTANRTIFLPDASGTLILSGQAIQGLGVSTGGNTLGDTGTTIGTVVFEGLGAVTLSQVTAAGSLATVRISAPSGGANINAIGVSTGGNTAGTTGTTQGTYVLVGGNQITLSQSTAAGSLATVTISGRDAVFGAGVSTGGNTSGTTGTVTGTLVLAGGNNVTLSQSTDAGGATVTISAGGGGAAPTLSLFENIAVGASTTSALGNATLNIYPLTPGEVIFPGNMTVSTMFLNLSGTVSTGAGFTRSVSVGFYTIVNSTQLSLAFSASTSFGTGAGNMNINDSFAGFRWLTFHSSQWDNPPAFSGTNYRMGVWNRSSGGTQTFNFYGIQTVVGSAVRSGFISSGSSNDASLGFSPLAGVFSVTFSTAMPASIHASDISKPVAAMQFAPHFVFNNMGSNIV